VGQGDREFTVTLPYALWFLTFSPTEFFGLFFCFLPSFLFLSLLYFSYLDSPANYALFNPERTQLSARADVYGQEYTVF
jgi:hypothetical protein